MNHCRVQKRKYYTFTLSWHVGSQHLWERAERCWCDAIQFSGRNYLVHKQFLQTMLETTSSMSKIQLWGLSLLTLLQKNIIDRKRPSNNITDKEIKMLKLTLFHNKFYYQVYKKFVGFIGLNTWSSRNAWHLCWKSGRPARVTLTEACIKQLLRKHNYLLRFRF